MKKIALLLLTGLLSVLFLANPAMSESEEIGWQVYKNQDYGFSISFPENWEVKERYRNTVVVALSPVRGARDNFRENVNLNVQALQSGMRLEKYYRESIRDMQEYLFDFDELSSGNLKINDVESKYLVYTHKIGNVKVKVLEVLMVHGSFGFKITCTAISNAFDRYRDMFRDILSSFVLEVE
ncbi:MAG: PsbP-related protein [Thermodesulfobacteriota bacterium]